jgi:hypothetical protein
MYNKSRKSKGFLIAIIIILSICIIGVIAVAGYVMYMQQPSQIYKTAISAYFNKYNKELSNIEGNEKAKEAQIYLDVDVNEDENDLTEKEKMIVELINNIDLNLKVQFDNTLKNGVVNLESTYDNEKLLDIKAFCNMNDKLMYLYSEDYYDKYIKMNLEDVIEEKSDVFDSFDEINYEKISKFQQIIKKELLTVIKSEYCTKNKEIIEINNQNINATKNTIKFTAPQLMEEMINILNDLKNNEEFFELFDENDREDVKEFIENAITEINDKKNTVTITDYIQIDLYTKGLKPEILKIDVTVETENEKAEVNITKNNEKEIFVNIKENLQEILEITFNIESENTINMTISGEEDEIGKFSVKLNYTEKTIDEIDKINSSKVIELESMTDNDYSDILENLEKTKIYSLIQEYSNLNNTYNLDNNSDLEDNQISTYDNKTIVTFGIPEGYKATRYSDEFINLDNEEKNIYVELKTKTENVEEFYNDLLEKKQYDEENYTDLKLTNPSSMTLNGMKFYYSTYTYTYNGTYSNHDYCTRYLWTEISDDDILVMEIEDNDKKMLSEELKEILTISIQSNTQDSLSNLNSSLDY